MAYQRGERARVVVALAGGDGLSHLAYPTARRTLCLDIAGFRPLLDREQHAPATCERCTLTLDLIATELRRPRPAGGGIDLRHGSRTQARA